MSVKQVRQSKGSAFASIIDASIDASVSRMNFVDFIQSPQGLPMKLYPVQYFLGKCLMGVPLDYKETKITVWDKFREHIRFEFNEREYLRFLHSEGRINVRDWKDLPERGFNEAILICGRRGGKSSLVSALASYKLYCLLSLKDPQSYYDLVPGDPIDFTIMAQDETGAGRLFDKIKAGVIQSTFFRPFLYGTPGSREMKFLSDSDRSHQETVASIALNALTCTTRSSRGPSSLFLTFDEFAFFKNAVGANSDEVYEAATPAAGNFKTPEGDLDSLILTITSPYIKVGKTWSLYETAMTDGPDSGIFAFRCSTAEMNYRISPKFLAERYKRSPTTWMAEFGGEFLESSGSFVPAEKITACVDPGRRNVAAYSQNLIGQTFFWGTDLGLRKDATAVAIGHWALNERSEPILIVDFIDRLMVGEGRYKDAEVLELPHILEWFEELNLLMPGRFGLTDQYAGAMFIQLLKQRKIEFVELLHLTAATNSEMFFTLKGYMDQGIIRFPEEERFLSEIKTVHAVYAGKYQINVQAPNEKGAHDDMVDAVALMALRAQRWLAEEGSKSFAFSQGQMLYQENAARPDPLQVDLQNSSLLQIRHAERMYRQGRKWPESAGAVSPRLRDRMIRKGRF